MRYSILGIICIGIVGCTMSVNVVKTEGQAEDVIDETQTNQPDISPELSTPAVKL